MPRMMFGLAAALALLAAPAAAQTAVPQEHLTGDDHREFAALVSSYLDDVERHFGQGLARAPGFSDEIVAMQPGDRHNWTIELAGGGAYRIIGACDNECENMDIELIDVDSGQVVASDVLPDDYPVVSYAPASDGRYIVRLLMQTCTVAPCFAGARLLSGAASRAAP